MGAVQNTTLISLDTSANSDTHSGLVAYDNMPQSRRPMQGLCGEVDLHVRDVQGFACRASGLRLGLLFSLFSREEPKEILQTVD